MPALARVGAGGRVESRLGTAVFDLHFHSVAIGRRPASLALRRLGLKWQGRGGGAAVVLRQPLELLGHSQELRPHVVVPDRIGQGAALSRHML